MAEVTFPGAVAGSLVVVAQLRPKQPVRVATAASLAAYTRSGNVITANANGALAAVDGVTLVANDRLLLKNGAAGADNGIYTVTTVGAGGTPYVLTRATDADTSAEVKNGLSCYVDEGTTLTGTVWTLSTEDPITLNTTALTFIQTGGAGLVPADASVTAAKLTGTAKNRALALSVGGSISASMADTADYPLIVPYDCTVTAIKCYAKVAPTGAMAVQVRKSSDAATPTFADLATVAATFSANENRKSVGSLSVNLTEGDILNFSITTGSGSNLLVELQIVPR